jgi:hypothetical protein
LASEAGVFANTLDGTLYAIVLGQFLDRVALEEVMTTSVDAPGWWLVFDCVPHMPLLPTLGTLPPTAIGMILPCPMTMRVSAVVVVPVVTRAPIHHLQKPLRHSKTKVDGVHKCVVGHPEFAAMWHAS